jgi:hypothetical protein
MPENARNYLRPGAVDRIFGRILTTLVRIGLIRGHFYVLEVRGRKSGRTITLPVDPLDFAGRRYLVCARGNANWVRNARAAGEVVLVRALRRRRYAARELPPDMRSPLLKPISTASPARSSAFSPPRKGRWWRLSTIWRRATRSSNSSRWTRPRLAPGQPRNEHNRDRRRAVDDDHGPPRSSMISRGVRGSRTGRVAISAPTASICATVWRRSR